MIDALPPWPDLVVGLLLVGLLVRGWLRGLVREALDVAGLVLGVVVAFRLSGPFGDAVAARTDVPAEIARLGAGLVLVLIVGAGIGLASRALGRLARLPGLSLPNRVLGAGFAGLAGAFLVVLVASLLRVVPAVDETLDGSVVGAVSASPAAEAVVGAVVGDEVVDSLLSLQSRLGTRRVVLEGDERVEIDPAADEVLTIRPGDAEDLYVLLNETRLSEGADPLAWSPQLADVALGHAREMYRDGYVSHLSPTTGRVGDRVSAAGIRVRVVGENLALAPSVRAVHDGFLASPGHLENLVRPEFHEVGIGAVSGPLGLMVVEVYAGR